MAQLSATVEQQLAYTEQATLSVLSTDDARSLFNDNWVPLMHWARKDGQVDTVPLHVERGLDFDSVDNNGLTLLHFAAAMGQSKAVQDLVRSGSPKSVVAGQFATPLHQAASNGHMDTVIAMLKEGCSLNEVDGDGRTVLHWAAQGGHTEIVRELVDRGCDKNARQTNGCTPLFTAARFGRTDVVRELIQLGATKSVVAGDFGTPLHQATANAHMETVMALLKDDELCEQLTKDETTLSKKKQMVRRYIGVCNAVSETSVMWALRFGHVEVFKLLISEGGAISDRDTNIYSLTAFEQCFVGGQASKLSEFCEAGGIRGCGEGLKGVLARLIALGFVDAHKVLCLCAISGDSVFLDEQYSELVASNACAMPAAVECSKYYFDKGVPFISQLSMGDKSTLNPLQMSILSMKCFKMGYAIKSVELGTKDHMEFIKKLLCHPVLKKLVHDSLPNGLSPLDLAQQFELSDVAALIEAAGGRPGAWRNIPPEIVMEDPQALLKLKEAFAYIKAIAEYSKHGHEFVQNKFSEILGDDRNSIKEWVLSQPPELEHIVNHVLHRIQMRHWKRLGISLGMDKLVVDDLEQRFSGDSDCCLETLSYWIEHGRSVTWRTLLDALGRFETWQTINELTDNIVTVLGVCHQVSVQVCVACSVKVLCCVLSGRGNFTLLSCYVHVLVCAVFFPSSLLDPSSEALLLKVY